jgi:hypothetical protein
MMRAIWKSVSGIGLMLFALLGPATPASAQWTQVPEVSAGDVFSVWTKGDTIVAGADSFAYVSTNAGATWKRSTKVAAGVLEVSRVRVRNHRLYAGTMGQGVFVSDNLGDTWSDYNQGLVGGINNAQMFIADLLIRGDSLFAATVGDGAWVRNLTSGNWGHFGAIFAPEQSTNMTAIAAGGSRMVACGGFNGTVFWRDPGQADWTLSLLFNDHFAAGLAALSATWNGSAWVVGSNIGVFQSASGQGQWTFVDFGLRPLFFTPVVTHGTDFFVSLGAGNGTLIALSHDDGVTWQNVDTLASALTYDLAVQGTTLYAGRVGGLWRRSIASLVAVPSGGAAPRLAFAIAGSNPVGEHVRFRFELPEAGPIAIEVFDVKGRRVGDAIRETRPSGAGEVEWDAGLLHSGVYFARLSAAGGSATTRLVRTGIGRR